MRTPAGWVTSPGTSQSPSRSPPCWPRRWQVVAVALAITLAFARLYAGVHLPLDVVGGAGVGLLFGTLARWTLGLGGEGLPPRPGIDPA